MKWRLEFRSEQARIVARYVVEALTPTAALALGRQDAEGWRLYRIAKDS